MTFSRDGKRWERLANRPSFMPRGYVGSFDGGIVFGANIPFIEYGDDLYVYYIGTRDSHSVSLDAQSSLCLARTPKGRLVSRCAGEELGALITKPFVLKHRRIGLNLDTRRGLTRVELADIQGNPIEGFKAAECAELKLNSLDAEVVWNGASSLEKLQGQTVRLRIYLWQGRLFSINFGD